MQMTSSRFMIMIGMSALIGLSACGDDDKDKPDPVVADSGVTDRGVYTPPDSGPTPPTDSGVTTGPRDAGHYCAPNTGISVQGENVTVNEAASLVNGSAVLNCIDEPPPRDIPGSITLRVCVNLVGSSSVSIQNELDDLEIALFYDKSASTGMDINPTFTSSTWVDVEPSGRVDFADDVNHIKNPTCQSGVEFELGRASTGASAAKAAIDYTIRLRSKTSTGGWATVYHDQLKVFADRIVGGGASPSNCDPTNCTGILQVYAIRKATLDALITASGATISGAENLSDGVGEGHALVVSGDCQLTPMSHAVAGFAPTPQASAYLVDGSFNSTATETDESGLYLGLGFGSATESRAAVGIMRDADTCTEEFAGNKFNVYPDAITVFASGPATTLNQN
jgi:hypothetical protein